MDKNIFEEGPRRGHAAGDTSIEQQASQLASDIKYKARQKMKGTSGSNMSPAQVQALYRSLLGSSTAPGAVKAIVKNKLFKEQVDTGVVPVSEHVKGSSSYVLTRVFLEAEERKFVIKVVDKATGNTSYRKADRAKIAELRANKNIASVEITGRKEPDDAYKGDPKPAGGKKAKKDYDGDGKIESGTAEYMGSRDKAIKKAMAKEDVEPIDEIVGQLVGGALGATKGAALLGKMGVKGAIAQKAAGGAIGSAAGEVLDPFKKKKDKNPLGAAIGGAAGGAIAGGGIGAAKQAMGLKSSYDMEGEMTEEFITDAKEEDKEDKKLDVMKGKNGVKINPSLGESIRAELAALKAKKVEEAIAEAKAAGPSLEERRQMLNKDKMMKKRIMMQKQARLPKEEEENDGTFDALRTMKPDAENDDPRSMPTKINLAKNKLRAMGLKMSYDMEGEMTEATEDSLRDRRMERGGVDGNTRYDRPAKNVATGPKKKYDGMSALEKVKAEIRGKYGKGAVMDTKKK